MVLRAAAWLGALLLSTGFAPVPPDPEGPEGSPELAPLLESPGPVAPGARVSLRLALREAPAPELPLTLALEAADVRLAENRLDRGDLVDRRAERPRFEIFAAAPDRLGRFEVRGRLVYWVCSERSCLRRRHQVRWYVEVVGPR